MTHDLVRNVLHGLDAELIRVVVDELDINYTLGEAARRREEILRRLKTGEPVEDDEETW